MNVPPDDDLRQALLDSVRPPAWVNPRATRRYNLVVIGAGPAGLTAAREAAALGAKVALIEHNQIGGSCLNVGCVPSKSIIHSARLLGAMREAEALGGLPDGEIGVDFPAVMRRMRRIQARLGRSDSVQRLSEAGIEVFFGHARFVGRDRIDVAGQALRFSKALIATGARPMTKPIPGLAEVGYLTNETVFDLTTLPARLLVIGGGPLGCELAQAFRRFGAHVILAEDDPMFLGREERDAAQVLSDSLARDGVEIHLNSRVVAVRAEGGDKVADLVSGDQSFSVRVDEILTGIGRAPNVEGLDLEAAGVAYNLERGIEVNDFLQTANPRIYAAGDVCLEHKFTHAAEAAGRLAMRNALVLGRGRVSRLTIPWCTYTDPEIAHVGLYVRDMREQAIIPLRTFTILMHDIDRAVTAGDEEGFLKIHVRDGDDQILGATVVARGAGELINEIAVAMNAGIGLHALARVIHAYPTHARAIQAAAEAYDNSRRRPLRAAVARYWLAVSRWR